MEMPGSTGKQTESRRDGTSFKAVLRRFCEGWEPHTIGEQAQNPQRSGERAVGASPAVR